MGAGVRDGSHGRGRFGILFGLQWLQLRKPAGMFRSAAARIPIIRTKKYMKTTPRWTILLLILLAAVAVTAPRIFSRADAAPAPAALTAQSNAAQKNAAPAQQSQIERGRYLVEDVAMCGECHTPRKDDGELDNSQWLQGAPIWIMPVHPDTKWAMRAPALAGFQGFTDAQGESILERGIGPNGLPIQPPMHIYHMNHADATAIIAYLKSLPGTYPRD
jgi:mono/diheme cytochrome c family protein